MVFGILWIIFSDRAVESIVDDLNALSKIQTYKGWFYVLVTGVMFFFLSLGSLKYQRNLTERDSLTGLLNRHMFRRELERALSVATLQKSTVTLLLINLDNFRQINNTSGQQVGDLLLQQVAETLKAEFKIGSLIGRLAGDEFGVAITNENQCEAFNTVESIQQQLMQLRAPGSPGLLVSARVGIATFPDDADALKSLLAASTLALEEAKQLGLGEIRVYNRSYGEEAQTRLEMLADLREAIAKQELSLVYQPQFDTQSKRITGVEVLVRWLRPEKSNIRPDIFIPLAEQAGLIQPITDFVCRKSIQELTQCGLLGRDKAIPRLSINISARDLASRQGAELFFERFASLEENWSVIQLEITETAVMENLEIALPILEKLRAKGIQLSIDDFGTGYSSLGVLRKLPVQELKIDSSFTREMTESADDLQLVKAILAMTQSLKLRTVAEGVETTEQALLLRENGCTELQGFLMSPPLTIDQLQAFIKQHQGTLGKRLDEQ